MGFKKTLPPYHLINGGVMTGTATVTSATVNVWNLDNIAIQVGWTGTPTGTIAINCSIDNINFDSLTFDPALAQPSGSADNYLISLNQLPYPYLQVQYVNASSTGVLNVWIFGKDVN